MMDSSPLDPEISIEDLVRLVKDKAAHAKPNWSEPERTKIEVLSIIYSFDRHPFPRLQSCYIATNPCLHGMMDLWCKVPPVVF